MIDHTVILLNRDKKRVKNFLSNIKPSIPNLKKFKAIDCETDEIENFFDRNKKIKIYKHYLGRRICTRGGIANVISHIKIWRKIISDKIPEMVILEDDADVPPDYLEKLQLVKQELPNNYDLCHLYVQPSKLKLAHLDESLHLPNKFFINKGYKTLGMVAYLISLSGAANLLKEFEVITQLVDIQINRLIKKQKVNGYKFFSAKNNIVNLHHPNLSTNVQGSHKYIPHDPCIISDIRREDLDPQKWKNRKRKM